MIRLKVNTKEDMKRKVAEQRRLAKQYDEFQALQKEEQRKLKSYEI